MLTIDDLKLAASLMDAYGETRPGYVDSDAALQGGPTNRIVANALGEESSASGRAVNIEVVQDPVTLAWRIVRS